MTTAHDTEWQMNNFIKGFKMFDLRCFKAGFEKTSENIELFRAYMIVRELSKKRSDHK